MSNTSVFYENLRPAQFAQRISESPVAYLPLGTLEWHSYHLPLGTDGIQAQNILGRIAEHIGGIVLPMIFLGPDCHDTKNGKDFYGMDILGFEEGNPQQLAGSAYYVEDAFFASLLDNILSNLARAGFKIIVAHGHGPSTNFFSEQKEHFKEKFGLETFTLFDLGFQGKDGLMTDHAATNETSLIMAMRPELADLSCLPKEEIPTAVWGRDPRKYACAEEGNRLINLNLEHIEKQLKPLIVDAKTAPLSLDYTNQKNLLEE